MRVVLDTNVVASALLWGGIPESLIRLAGEGRIELITSTALLQELTGILGRAKFAQKLSQKKLSASEIVAQYQTLAEVVEPVPIIEGAGLRDPDDIEVLACAASGQAEMIVTGDDDLLSLREWGKVRIVSPAECFRQITGR